MRTHLAAAVLALVAAARAEAEGAAAPEAGAAPAAEAAPASVFASGRLALAPSWDSNATRAARRDEVRPDESLVLYLGADVTARPGGGHELTLAYDGGGKLFREERGQDQLATRLSLSDELRVADSFTPGLQLSLDDRTLRDGDRDSRALAATASLGLGPFGALSLRPRLTAGYRHFLYKPDERFTSHGPSAGLSLRASPFRRHSAVAYAELSRRGFPEGDAFDAQGALVGERVDTVTAAGLDWTWRGRVLVGGGYGLTLSRSNGFGLASDRHRLQAIAGTKLPGRLLLSAQAALQVLRFPDGLFVSEDLLLVDDDENLSSISVKLSRPLGEGFAIEARYQLYRSYFSRTPIEYERQLAGLGVSYRFDTRDEE